MASRTTQFQGGKDPITQEVLPITPEQRAHNRAVRLQHGGEDDGLCVRRYDGQIVVMSTSRALAAIEHGEKVPEVVDVTDSNGHVSQQTRHITHPVELAE